MKEGSPADQDGLMIGDAIMDFGGVKSNVAENALQQIVARIQGSIGQPIEVKFLRKNIVLGTENEMTI